MPKILLVEDNEINRDITIRRLSKAGYEVLFATNGIEGLEKTVSESPDLILMDMGLPELDGWMATSKIKSNNATSSIPIIALTAHAMTDDRDKALNAGCDEYESKPVDFKRLIYKMETLLHNRGIS